MSEYVALIQDEDSEKSFDELKPTDSESGSRKSESRKYAIMRTAAIILVIINAILMVANLWASSLLNAKLPEALGLVDVDKLPVIDQWAYLPEASRESELFLML